MSTAAATLAVETDTRLADLYTHEATLIAARNVERDTIHRVAGDRRTKLPRDRFSATGPWERTDEDVLDIDPETLTGWDAADYPKAVAKYRTLTEGLAGLRTQILDLEAVYNANRWSRFFIVTNSNGHIHKTRPDTADRCSTCFYDTPFRWLPTLSGLTQADAVTQIGPVLCSVCFPDAPVEHTNGEAHADRAEREARRNERQAAADAKRAKRVEKALFADDPDRFIRVELDRVDTIAKARSFLKDGRCYQIADGKDHSCYPQATMTEVAEALAARLDLTLDAVWAEVEKKAQAQHRKDQREAAAFLARNPGLAAR